MNALIRSLSATALLAGAVGLAHATPLTLTPGQTVSVGAHTFSEFAGSLIWEFDPAVLTAHPERGWSTQVSIVAPASPLAYATIPEEPGAPVPISLGVSMPLASLQGDLQGQKVDVQHVQATGGLVLTQSPPPGVATTMPFTHLTNMRVDWASHAVYADLFYDMGQRLDVRLMTFSASEVKGMRLDGNFALLSEPLLDLQLTQEGHEALAHQGLDLPAWGQMGSLGYMYVSAYAQLAPVPEPSRMALMALGLGVLGLLARRTRL